MFEDVSLVECAEEIADEVVYADFNEPETLDAALKGADGVILVTDYWSQTTIEEWSDTIDRVTHGKAVVDAAKRAWSLTLPRLEGHLEEVAFSRREVFDAEREFTGELRRYRRWKRVGSRSRVDGVRRLAHAH